MVRLYVAVSNRLAELFQGDRADAGMEELGYVVLLAVISKSRAKWHSSLCQPSRSPLSPVLWEPPGVRSGAPEPPALRLP